MKCKNCGAELNNGRCEYCGSFDGYYIPNIDAEVVYRAISKEKIEVTCMTEREPLIIRGI